MSWPGIDAAAGREAARLGTCPVALLPEFVTDHWAAGDICAGFGCERCVADPVGLGCPERPADEVRRSWGRWAEPGGMLSPGQARP